MEIDVTTGLSVAEKTWFKKILFMRISLEFYPYDHGLNETVYKLIFFVETFKSQ